MAERTITIKIVGDASKASKAMSEAASSAGTLEAKVDGLTGKWGNFGSVFAGVVAGGALQQVGGWLKAGAEGAAEDAAAMGRLEKAVTNTGASYDDYGSQIDDAISRGQDLAFTDGETANALSLLTAMTGDTGEALSRLSVAQDLARGTGMSLEQASKLLGKVTDENSAVLKRYGINVEAGASAQDVMNAADAAFGGQAGEFAESDSGKWLKLTQQLGEVQETIGGVLIPVLTILTGAIALVFSTLDPLLQLIAANFIPIMIALAPVLATVGVAILASLVPAIIAKTAAVWASVTAWLAANAAMLPIIAIALAIGIAVAALYIAWQSNFLGIRDITQQVFDFLGPYVTAVIDGIRVGIETTLAAISAVWNAVWPTLQAAFELFWTIVSTAVDLYFTPLRVAIETGLELIRSHWETVWNAVKTIFDTVWGVISTAVDIYLTPLRTAIETGVNLIRTHWETAWNLIKSIYEGVWQAISTIVGIYLTPIRTTIETIVNGIRDHWSGVWLAIQGAVEAVWGPIQTAVDTGINAVSTVVTTVLGGVQTTWDTIWGAIRTTVETIWAVGSGIASVVGTGIDAVKSKIDEVLGLIQGAWDTGWGAVKGTVDAIWNGANGILRIADGGISSVRSRISEVLSAIKSEVWDPIWNSFTGVVSTVMDGVKGIVNGVINGINAALGLWNNLNFKVPELDMGPLGKWGGMSIGTDEVGLLQPLATGGIVLKPTAALVGEAGPEAVVPLSALPAIIRESLGLNNGVVDMPPPGVNDAVTDMPLPDQPRYINLPPGAAPPTIMDDPDDTRYVNIPPGTEPPTIITGPGAVAPLPPALYIERDPLLDLMKPSQNGPGSASNLISRSSNGRSMGRDDMVQAIKDGFRESLSGVLP